MAELQDGIFWGHGQVPPRHFAITFLRFVDRSIAADVDVALSELVEIWRGLVRGQTPDLPGASVPPSGLSWLLAFGRKTFEVRGAARRAPTLRRRTWLGGINFGGSPGPQLIHARAAGFYFCPAAGVAGEYYPGQSILLAQGM